MRHGRNRDEIVLQSECLRRMHGYFLSLSQIHTTVLSVVKELKIDRSFIAVTRASGRSRKDNYFPNGEKLAISKCTFALSPVHH